MPLRILVITFLLLSLCVGCSKTAKKEDPDLARTAAKTVKSEEGKKVLKKGALLPRQLYSAQYTDGNKWNNGIDTMKKNVFFFSIAKNAPIPINIGYRLKFAAAGEAVVQTVFRLKQEGKDSVFITVDKTLDPVGDGAPNPIYLMGFVIIPVNYSKDKKWSRGINLEKPNMFFYKIKKDDPVTLRPGDRLKFAETGEARVVNLSRMDSQDNFASVFVVVDKPLNPPGDGHPNPIEVIFKD